MLWVIPFIIEKTANKIITTLVRKRIFPIPYCFSPFLQLQVFAVLNLIFYVVYILSKISALDYALYVFLLIVNALLIPLLAVQVVDDATSAKLELAPGKLSRKNRIPIQR